MNPPRACRLATFRSARLKTAALIGLAVLPAVGHGQSGAATTETAAPDLPVAAPRRLAETLRPTHRPAPALNGLAYAPIRKQEDQADIPEIEMFVGESRVFPTPGVARIAVGNGQIMSAASLDNREVIVFANAVGTSSLFVWNEDGRYQRVKINIVPGDTSRFAREIAAFLSGIPNAKASVIGDKVIVEGDDLRDQDIGKIDELAKRYPQIVNFTNRLGWEQTVLMDVKVAEFPVNELREIGLKWNATGGVAAGAIWGPLHKGGALSQYQLNLQTGSANPAPITAPDGSKSVPIPAGLHAMTLVNLGLNAQLALLAQNGRAAILAEPQLSARNGARATFLAGGEYPYTVSTINGPTVMFKPYGIKLDLVPRVDRHGVIRATIDSEVSAIDPSLSTTAGPALSTRRTSTEFNVRDGETLVLAGLLSRRMSTTIDKVPFLGDIPILGALFRSKRFQNDETELVVFVTPTVVDARTPGLADRIARTTQKLEDHLGRPPFLSEPIQPGRDPARPDGPARSEAPDRPAGGVAPAPVRPLPAATPIRPVEPAPLPRADAIPPTGARTSATNLLILRPGTSVRATPDPGAPVLVALARDSVVKPGPQKPRNGWRSVLVGQAEGWIPTAQLEATSRPPALIRHADEAPDRHPPAGTAGELDGALAITADDTSADRQAGPPHRVVQDRLALHVTPDINAPVLAHLRFDARVDPLPQPARGGWVAVRAGERRGWVLFRGLKRDDGERP